MKKLLIIIPILLVAIGGGFLLAQGKLFTKAEAQITAEKAKELALELYPGTIVGFEFDNDRRPHYEIDIESDGERVEVEVNAVTSKAVVKERKAIKNQDSASTAVKVTQEDAIKKAINHYAQQTSEKIDTNDMNKYVHEVDLEKDDRRYVYDIELRTATEKADIEVDANTGDIVKFEVEALKNSGSTSNNSGTSNNGGTQNNAGNSKVATPIDLEAAKKIALSKASGTVVKAEFDADDNVFEIEIRNGKMEYDFEIDPKTGAIIIYEEDLDND